VFLRWDIPGILDNNVRSTGVSPWPLPLALQDDCRGPTQMQSKGCATRFVWEPECHLGAASVHFEGVIAPCVSA